MARFQQYAVSPSMSHFRPPVRERAKSGLDLLLTPEEELTQGERAKRKDAVIGWTERRLGREYLSVLSERELVSLYRQELSNNKERRDKRNEDRIRSENGRRWKDAEKLLRTFLYTFEREGYWLSSEPGASVKTTRPVLLDAVVEILRYEAEKAEERYLSGISDGQARKSSIDAHKQEYMRQNGGKRRERREFRKGIEDLTG